MGWSVYAALCGYSCSTCNSTNVDRCDWQLLTNDSKQRDAAITGIEEITKLIRRYAEIEHLYLSNEQYRLSADLDAAVIKLYSQILEYEARAACQFNRRVAVQTLRNIIGVDGWDSMLESVKQLATNCEILAKIIDTEDRRKRMERLETVFTNQNKEIEELLRVSQVEDTRYRQTHLAELKIAREEETAWQHMAEESRCFESLRTTDYLFHKEKNPDQIPGTCQWFLNHPRYQEWCRKEGSWLWVTADPGCGKSVLSRFLIDHCLRSPTDKIGADSVCYFFFKDDSEENKSATHAMCAILHQLFSQKGQLVRHALPAFRLNGKKLAQLFDELWDILVSAAGDPEAGTTFCVLDALDECSESTRTILIRKLAKHYSERKSASRLQFLVTSRPNTPIGDQFWQHNIDPASIQLMGENEAEVEAISVEIGLVIEEKVKQFNNLRRRKGVDDDTHVEILDHLNSIENRTYLWVSLIFPELERNAGLSKKRLLAVIHTIPSTVDEAYEKILAHSNDYDQARKLLHIVVAAKRPLTLAEMNLALAIGPDHRRTAEIDLEPDKYFQVTVRELCGLFVSIRDSKIYLIHQTAKEFLIGVESEDLTLDHGKPWKSSLDPDESDLLLAKACIYYLSLETFGIEALEVSQLTLKWDGQYSRTFRTLINKYPFYQYASDHVSLPLFPFFNPT